MTAMLDRRAQTLLKTLIERYIAEGQPVGSRTLPKFPGLERSPATPAAPTTEAPPTAPAAGTAAPTTTPPPAKKQ